jgi:hypothetical protein
MDKLTRNIFRNLSPYEARLIATKHDMTIVPWLCGKLQMGLTDSQAEALAHDIAEQIESWNCGISLGRYRARLLSFND